MRRALALIWLLAVPAHAQQDDRSYLTAFLEDNLSGAGRVVTITGFTGALSSQAAIKQMTIADDDGVWITLNGLVLDWSRSSLLSGEVIVNELSAEEIIIARAPNSGDSALPSPEAAGFSLPELSVSVEIGKVSADRIVLEPALLGQSVEGSLEASLSLVAGEGKASFALLRDDDGPDGQITLDASYSNTGRMLAVSLIAKEGEGGLAATLLGLPGAPSAEFSVLGSGPLEDFGADVLLATDGEQRLAGRITLASDAAAGYRFKAALSGNMAPLFAPDYAAFFGPDVSLIADGLRSSTGRLTLNEFSVLTRSLKVSGAATLAADGLPEELSLNGKLASPDGAPVLLPLSGDATRVHGAEIALSYSQENEAGWKGSFQLEGLDRPDFAVGRLELSGFGQIGRSDAGRSFDGTAKFTASGLRPTDPAIAAALGQAISGGVDAKWREGEGALTLQNLQMYGEDYQAQANLEVEGLDKALLTTGRVELIAQDFGRFSALVGRPLGGSGTAVIEGSASRLSGAFDATVRFAGTRLKVGVAEVDRLLDGPSSLDASIKRDETGTTLRSLSAKARTLELSAAGVVSSQASDLTGRLTIGDLGDLGPGYRGAVSLDVDFTGTPEDGRIGVAGTASALAVGRPELDRVLAGQSVLAAVIAVKDGELQVEDARLTNPQVSVTATGRIAGALRQIDLQARLNNLGILLPEFPGALTVSGRATQDDKGYLLDLRGTGPGAVNAKVSGRIDGLFKSASLDLSGTAQAGLSNVFLEPRSISGPVRFDLKLNGPLRLSSLAGRVSLAGGRLADPRLGLAFERIEAIVDLSAGKARVSVTAQASTGGKVRIDGPIGLSAPYSGDLAIAVDRIGLVDPELYQTVADGSLRFEGPLTGGALIAGRINLSETEVRIPSSGFASAGGLPDLRHVNEPQEVLATRRKAGLLGTGSGLPGGGDGSGRFRLNVEIVAPNRVFVRGRGIDAELGGALTLSGDTAAIVPSGGLNLIRGRLEILGKRLVLTAADLTLEGDFIPDILVQASTESDGITSFVTIEGPADDPNVSFTSVPELPQEEILARLLFGRGLDTISALQAAQLANAVAVLAGRAGEGVIGRLRQSFGLDDLDLTTAEDGATSLRAGKYIAENLYTEIEVDQEGKSRINLNLDVRPGVTLKGRVAADGETGIGIFVERDY